MYIILIPVALILSCSFIFNSVTFYPDKEHILDVKKLPQGTTELFIKTKDNVSLHSLYFKHSKTSEKLIIYFHGNAGNVYNRIKESIKLSGTGCDVLLISYRGYGKSDGEPSEQGLYIDGNAAFEYASGTLGYDSKNIIIYGRSLGTAVAVNTAQFRDMNGVILITPFSSGKDLASELTHGSMTFLASGRLTSSEKINNLKCPLLVIHGTADEVVPYSLGIKLYSLYNGKKQFVTIDSGMHNDLEYTDSQTYWNAITDFVSKN